MGIKAGAADQLFVYYCLKSKAFADLIAGATVQTGVPHINLGVLRSWRLIAPQPVEQHAIGQVLGSLDEKIEHNQQTAATLEGIARALYQSWFVDFEPVRRAAAGEKMGLPSNTAALFSKRLSDDGIPEGWAIKPVGDVYDIVAGNTPSTEDPRFWEGPHFWTTPKDLSRLQLPVTLSSGRTLTDSGLAACSSGLLPVGTLLLSSRAPIGYLAFANVSTAINQGIAAFRRRELSTSFAWVWCQAEMPLIKANANGSTFQEISKGNLRQLPMIQATNSVMQAFVALVDPIVEREKGRAILGHSTPRERGIAAE